MIFDELYLVKRKKLTISFFYSILIKVQVIVESADMAQSAERHLGKVEVTGSIPVISLKKKPGKIKTA